MQMGYSARNVGGGCSSTCANFFVFVNDITYKEQCEQGGTNSCD